VKNYTPRSESVNEIFGTLDLLFSLTLLSAIPILPSPQSRHGQVAQLVERGPEKAGVGGSIPSLATIPFQQFTGSQKHRKFVSRTNNVHRLTDAAEALSLGRGFI
jgi:hypothetical protein